MNKITNMENHPFLMGISTVFLMAIFDSYVKLPEGKTTNQRWLINVD